MQTTITVEKETGEVLRQLSEKSKIPLISIMEELGTCVKMAMDDLPESNHLNFMMDWDLKNSMIHLRFNPTWCGTYEDLPEEIKECLKPEAEAISKESKVPLIVNLTKQTKKE